MTENQYINVTPHPRILGVLGDIEFSHWQCLAELIDNSFDEFQAAGGTVDRPSVAVSLPPANSQRATAEIKVQDNGRGMSLEAVTNAISAGWTSNGRHGSLGLFGMGFNISTARLGRRTTVRTSRAGDSDWIEVTLDLARIANSSKYQAPYRLVPKANRGEHGTTVTISELKQEQYATLCRPKTQNVIREKLGDVYSYLLAEKGFLLTLNGKKVRPRLPCVWDEKRTVTRQGVEIHAVQRIDRTLSSKKACMACGYWSTADAEHCEECGQDRLELRERKIWGWIGIQRYLHRTDYGLDFLRNGRKIMLKDKRVFLWQDEDDIDEAELEYPIDSGAVQMGRIVGEIHCDHVTPNYQKTAFEFETAEWRQVLREVRGTSPLRPKIAKSLGRAENRSPLALLFAGFRRQDPGLNYLIPGDGRNALHETAVKWAGLMRLGGYDYQSDELWYRAAYHHDNPIVVDPQPENDEILPGFGAGLLEPDVEPEGGTAPGTTSAGETLAEAEVATVETLDQRLQRYRDSADPIVDLTGSYYLEELGRVDLTAWAVRGQSLATKDERPAPVIVSMVRAPRLDVFVDAGHSLFREHGADIRDLALVEVAEFMRVRANNVSMPLSEIVAQLKSHTSSPRLTSAATAEESERLLELVRKAMVAPISADPAVHWLLLTKDERADSERRFAVEAGGVTPWNDAISSGAFIRYVPASAVIRIIQGSPGTFLDGCVFKRGYIALSDPGARALVVERLINPLGDLALLEQHRPRLDVEELARIRISCRLIARDLADNT
ncbi:MULTISPECIES: ATP-binding protein [unclassified Streptomyces]|uniref:ATP-binding protein n=1 Tax=unclassified Streptomyces TaxID=2593676 RepID=UPI0016607238|nr:MULTISPECIES: ATP-binding protein [unclassified Streptomyces]MBD0707664.1 ATP-binding protein [Streptomyces sp. CBMA291]MBD0713443.1 ATP-binding protein [Streptomyces sp. CBMA370]